MRYNGDSWARDVLGHMSGRRTGEYRREMYQGTWALDERWNGERVMYCGPRACNGLGCMGAGCTVIHGRVMFWDT